MEEVEKSIIKNGDQSSKRLKMANDTQINSNNNQSNSIVEETKRDRLSSLPDEILLQILSHLETFYAAKTAFFSRRWRNLWKGLTTYEFHTSDMIFDKLAKLVSLLTSPKIRVFEYSFCANLKNFKWKSAEKFYDLLIRRNVELNACSELKTRNRGAFLTSWLLMELIVSQRFDMCIPHQYVERLAMHITGCALVPVPHKKLNSAKS